MRQNLERALTAKRESRRVAFKNTLEIKDVIALANSGGGIILLSDPSIDRTAAGDRIREFELEFEIVDAVKDGKPLVAVIVGEAQTPIVIDGRMWVRHGARTDPATTRDVAGIIDRRVKLVRRSWLTAVRTVVQPRREAAAAPPTLSTEVRETDSPTATPIRVVDDPHVAAYRLVDYDKTHPYRQKELLVRFRELVPDRPVNQFDLLAVRHVHHIDAHPEFAHKSMFGTRQYSQKFLDWLVGQARTDPLFFSAAREEYGRSRLGTS